MADYKNEQWWIELQKSLEGFNDNKIKMSDSDLGRWNGAKLGGRKGGAKHRDSGHINNIQKKAASLGGKAQGHITGTLYGKYNMEKMSKEDKIRGAKKAGKIRASQSDFYEHLCNMGKKSAEKRIDEKIEKYKSIIKFIRKKEFTYSDMRDACKKYGIADKQLCGTAKKILREKSLVKQIHKGYNQFNPSLYIKIK
jgi:hypothetical protein